MARSDPHTNTHALLEHIAKLHAQLDSLQKEGQDHSNELVQEQAPFQRATVSSSHLGPHTFPVPTKTTQNSGKIFVEVSQDLQTNSRGPLALD